MEFLSTENLLRTVMVINITVAIGYFAFGAFIIPKSDAATPTWALTLFKWTAGAVFFIGGLRKLYEVYEINSTMLPMEYWLSWPYITLIILHDIVSLIAFSVGMTFISIRFYNRKSYTQLLDRSIEEQTKIIAQSIDRSDAMLDIIREAKRTNNALELVYEAMVGQKK